MLVKDNKVIERFVVGEKISEELLNSKIKFIVSEVDYEENYNYEEELELEPIGTFFEIFLY